METTMLALVLCLVMPYFAMMASGTIIPLTMMDKSVDDMYDGCSEAMGKKVQTEYFPREKNSNPLFKDAWKEAESCANDTYSKRKDKKLTKDQVHALVVYTEATPNVYEPFNAAVRVSADSYTTNAFKYHALHYWLTTALQTININKICRTTYRRSDITFTGEQNQEIRFGQFASTSTSPNLIDFGKETCFKIETCVGAPIQDYSCYDDEDEVLVPPYEKFIITEIAHGSYEQLKKCNTIFVLKNTGRKSNLNCKAAPKHGCNCNAAPKHGGIFFLIFFLRAVGEVTL